MSKQLLFAIDTETGGLSPYDHKLLQVGLYAAVVDITDNTVVADYRFEWIIKPSSSEKSVQLEAMQVNKLDMDVLERDGMSMDAFSDELVRGINGVIDVNPDIRRSKMYLIGQNIAFDMRFLHENVSKNAIKCLDSFRQFELMCYSDTYFNLKGVDAKSMSLNVMASEFGVQNEHAHTALSDAETTVKVMLEIRKAIKRMVNNEA